MILFPRLVLYLAAFFGLGGFFLRADDSANSNQAPSAPALATPAAAPVPPASSFAPPLLSTNVVPAPFLESHPELMRPIQPDATGFSQGAGTSTGEESPETSSTAPVPNAASSNPAPGPEALADHLLVVYNQADPDSKSLADYYAARRNIPAERVLGLSCPTTEEISRADYDNTIRSPIVSYLIQKNWLVRRSAQTRIGGNMIGLLVATRNDIWAIVLMRGVPLKIAPDLDDEESMPARPEFRCNAAAVDSELALLPTFGLPLGAFVSNPFYDAKMTGATRVGPALARSVILVTRLDGPTPDDVRRMIDDSLYAEKNRLAGLAVIDCRGITDPTSGYKVGDDWLRASREILRQDGWSVEFDEKPEIIPATDPCNEVALYLGWYAGTAAGPFFNPPRRFERGAIAYHLHSFSASTLRSDTISWAGPLIAAGAAATMGSVYEPMSPVLTPHEDIFTKRLLDGDYFAEAAYASQIALSWTITVVGDPLYRPFLKPFNVALADAAMPHTDHDDWLLRQKVQCDLAAGRLTANVDALKQALAVPGAGPVAYEGMGDFLEKFKDPAAASSAVQAYEKALDGYIVPVDHIRVGLKLAQHYNSHGDNGRALAEMDVLRELYPMDAKRYGIPDAASPVATAPDLSLAGLPPVTKNSSTQPTLPTPPKPPQPTAPAQ